MDFGSLRRTLRERGIWLWPLAAIGFTLFFGWFTFTKVDWRHDRRVFNYNQVPFVPAKSHYSSERVRIPPLPTPAATVPPQQRTGGAQ